MIILTLRVFNFLARKSVVSPIPLFYYKSTEIRHQENYKINGMKNLCFKYVAGMS